MCSWQQEHKRHLSKSSMEAGCGKQKELGPTNGRETQKLEFHAEKTDVTLQKDGMD